MSEFRGFICDDCGNVIAREQRNTYIERFTGTVNGEVRKDLCRGCLEKRLPQDRSVLKPLRRRASRTK